MSSCCQVCVAWAVCRLKPTCSETEARTNYNRRVPTTPPYNPPPAPKARPPRPRQQRTLDDAEIELRISNYSPPPFQSLTTQQRQEMLVSSLTLTVGSCAKDRLLICPGLLSWSICHTITLRTKDAHNAGIMIKRAMNQQLETYMTADIQVLDVLAYISDVLTDAESKLTTEDEKTHANLEKLFKAMLHKNKRLVLQLHPDKKPQGT